MSASANQSLRPAWNRGNSKGFQPPPQVASTRSVGEESKNTYNTFSALDDDDDFAAAATREPSTSDSNNNNNNSKASTTNNNNNNNTTSSSGNSNNNNNNNTSSTTNSRSEALRSGIEGRSSSVGSGVSSNGGGKSGRSLADLAARAPDTIRSRSTSTTATTSDPKDDTAVRFTRERLLSLRPPPLDTPKDLLRAELEGTVILSETAQDPVCWDTLDAEGLWAAAAKQRSSLRESEHHHDANNNSSGGVPPRRMTSVRERSSSTGGGLGGGGRWQRGVALPPEGQHKTKQREADDPSELWDDPGSHEGAAADFSAFGAMPSDDEDGGAFDFEKMAAASKKLEDDMRGRSRTSSVATAEESPDENGGLPTETSKIDPKRPLSTVGTTIRSGSGDHVNVFEDFDDPAASNAVANAEPAPIKAVDEDPTASSRLMAMIGVKKDESTGTDPKLSAWGASKKTDSAPIVAGLSLNPWGDPILTGGGSGAGAGAVQSNEPSGMDLQRRLAEEKATAERRRLDEEQQRRTLEQERTRAMQQQQQQQQQRDAPSDGVQSQVELVLMERISTILENSWGRSDLHSILSTLHSEDSRVIPLLNNVDALRALLLRNPRRVAIRQDPALRSEMAALLVTNAQWQQQQQHAQQHQQQRAMQQQQQQAQQQQELQMREQQRRMEERQARSTPILPDAPWFYSDPSKNIQGPFRGEEMRQWLEAGYFKGDLPISQSPGGPFRPLSHIFNDLSVAFAVPDPDAEAKAKEEERTRQEQAAAAAAAAKVEAAKREQAMLREQEQAAEAAAAAKRLEQEEKKKAKKKTDTSGGGDTGNESSAQLKLMLGLGSQGAASTSGLGQSTEAAKPAKKAPQPKTAKAAATPPAPEPAAPAPVKNAAPAWGGAARSAPMSRKSMSEIQKEEARSAAVAAMNNPSSRSSSSGWANVASARGGSTAWPGGAAKPTPASVVPTDARAGVQRSMSLQPKAIAATTRVVPGGTKHSVKRSQSVSGEKAADAFGAKMPPALEKWCKGQMQKLNGTDDLTLVAFCMTLNDSEEIRQYLKAYLGATPQVNSFASEFITRKGGGAEKQDEWESTVSGKKGRKKKSGAR